MRKKFMSWVLPGLAEVLESDQLLVNALMSEDFHTFDLPIIANSGKPA